MNTHLARGLQAWFEPDFAQYIGYLARNFDRMVGGAALGINVEQQPVGTFEVRDARRPHVNRNRREVRDVGERLFAVQHEVRNVALRVLGVYLLGANPGRRKPGRIFLVEHLALDAVGVAREHHRAIFQIRQHPLRNGAIVCDQIALGVAVLRPEDFLGIGHRRLRFGGRGRRVLTAAFASFHLSASVQFGIGNFILGVVGGRRALRAGTIVVASAWIGVVGQTKEAWLADTAAVGPLGEANSANQLWPHEMRVLLSSGFSGGWFAEWRFRLRALFEHRVDLAQGIAIEAGAHFVGVAQRAVGFVLTEQQRSEMSSRAVGIAVAADHEQFSLRTLDLQPIAGAGSAIRGVAQFGNDSFQLILRYRGVKIRAAPDHVIAIADRTLVVDQLAEQTLALLEWQRAHVKTIEAQQVEDIIGGGHGETQARDLIRIVDVHPSLQELKARPPAIVLRNDLAVEDKSIECDRIQREHDLGISISNIGAAARV